MKILTCITCSRSSPTAHIDPKLEAFAKEVHLKAKGKNIKWLQSLSKDQLVITAIIGG